jgi:hypothetical protein
MYDEEFFCYSSLAPESAIWAAGTHQLIWPTDHQESGGQLSSTVISPLTRTIESWTTRRWTGS